MMITASRSARTAAAIGLALALAACGSDDDGDRAEPEPVSEPEPEPEPEADDEPELDEVEEEPEPEEADEEPEEAADEPDEEPDAPAAAAGDYTPPGAELAIGEEAFVPFYSVGNTHRGDIHISLDAITRGDPSDLDEFDLGDRIAGLVPWYLEITVTAGAATDQLEYSTFEVTGLLPDGSRANNLAVLGQWETCPQPSAPGGFAEGDTLTSCTIALANENVEVVGAQYGEGEEYNWLDGEPIVWR